MLALNDSHPNRMIAIAVLTLIAACGSPNQDLAGSSTVEHDVSMHQPGDDPIPVPPPRGDEFFEVAGCELPNLWVERALGVRVLDPLPDAMSGAMVAAEFTSDGESDDLILEYEAWKAIPVSDIASSSDASIGHTDTVALFQFADTRLSNIFETHASADIVAFGREVLLGDTPGLFVETATLVIDTQDGAQFLWPCAAAFNAQLRRTANALDRRADAELVAELLIEARHSEALDASLADPTMPPGVDHPRWDDLSPEDRQFNMAASIPVRYQHKFMPGVVVARSIEPRSGRLQLVSDLGLVYSALSSVAGSHVVALPRHATVTAQLVSFEGDILAQSEGVELGEEPYVALALSIDGSTLELVIDDLSEARSDLNLDATEMEALMESQFGAYFAADS